MSTSVRARTGPAHTQSLYQGFSTGLSDEERVNFVRPKKIVIKKTRKKNGTKNRNGQILSTF